MDVGTRERWSRLSLVDDAKTGLEKHQEEGSILLRLQLRLNRENGGLRVSSLPSGLIARFPWSLTWIGDQEGRVLYLRGNCSAVCLEISRL